MGCAVDLLGDDAADLLQLAHEVRLRVQPAGGVHDEHVEAAGLGFFAGIVGHAGRVAALLAFDDVAAEPLAPDRELLDGGGAESIAGRDHAPSCPPSWHSRASLAIDVVLPEPLTPATMTTVGPAVL